MAMKIQHLPLGAWEPDAILYEGSHASEARNVIPIKDGYKCLPGVMAVASAPALPSTGKALAAHTFRTFSGSLVTVVASSDGKIYALESSSWVEKYSGSGDDTNRRFAEYGQALYCLYGTTLLKASISGTTIGNFATVEDAPAGAVLGVIRDFLWVGCITSNEGQVHWSGLDAPDTWPTVGSDTAQAKQSDTQIFPQGGKVQAIMGAVGAADGLIFTERAVHLASYIGSPYIFSFKEIDHANGLLAPKSAVITGPTCVYLSAEGWMVTDGATTKPLGIEKVDRWFFKTASPVRVKETIGCHDPVNRLCIWAFASDICPAGQFDRVLIYSYVLDRWSYGVLNTQTIFPDYVRQQTLEDLDAHGTLDSLGFSLDSFALREDRPLLSCFTTASKMGSFSGAPLEAIMESGEFGGNRMLIHGIRPLVDRGDAKSLPITRARQSDTPKSGTLRAQSRDGICYQHLSVSFMRGRVVIPAGGHAWRDTKGMDLLYELEGGF